MGADATRRFRARFPLTLSRAPVPTTMPALQRVLARHDPALETRVVRRLPMRYAAGADATLDRPAHVRAASGLVWHGPRLVVVQDDTNFLALVDPATGLAESIALPAGEGGRRQFDDGRGNK